MKFYHLTLLSRNKTSLTENFLFFTNVLTLNFNVIKKYYQKKSKKYFLTILKSPHVNKSAQEQFDFQMFSKQLRISFSEKQGQIYFLKKIQNNLLNDTRLKIKCLSAKNKRKSVDSQLFNPNNFKLDLNNFDKSQQVNVLKKKIIISKQNNKKIRLFLQTLDIYGELLNKISLDSSVGRAKD